jgi:hypothetical protein
MFPSRALRGPTASACHFRKYNSSPFPLVPLSGFPSRFPLICLVLYYRSKTVYNSSSLSAHRPRLSPSLVLPLLHVVNGPPNLAHLICNNASEPCRTKKKRFSAIARHCLCPQLLHSTFLASFPRTRTIQSCIMFPFCSPTHRIFSMSLLRSLRSFSTVNASEIAHFSRLSSQWWNPNGAPIPPSSSIPFDDFPKANLRFCTA